MATSLNLFPNRAAIGWVRGPEGEPLYDVMMTPEFSKALSALLDRVGGEFSVGIGDIEILTASAFQLPDPIAADPLLTTPTPDPYATIAGLTKQVAELQLQVEGLASVAGELAEIRKAIQSIEFLTVDQSSPSTGIDWEHPGKLGSSTPNTVAATTLSATGAISSGTTGTAGSLSTRRASDGAIAGTDTMVANVRELDNAFGDVVFKRIAAERLRLTAAGITAGGPVIVPGGASFLTTNTALTNGAAAAAGTLANAPVAGNPTKWIGINDNGTIRYIPAW